MNQQSLYRDIAERCNGDIYIGVVGPVRTGKSTFIKRFMETLVLPNMEGDAKRERATDELPQSGAGKTIMTTQPIFVPNEAVEVQLNDQTKLKMRLVDCVGYLIQGALGLNEGENARMVRTPWYDHDIPFESAAELGTRKVINEHSTLGVVVTTDGSITEFPRSSYVEAEERVVSELKALGKPFVMLLNSSRPTDSDTIALRDALQQKYDVAVVAENVETMGEEQLNKLMENVLMEFPLSEVVIQTPAWVSALGADHPVSLSILNAALEAGEQMSHMRDYEKLEQVFAQSEYVQNVDLSQMEMDQGSIQCKLGLTDGLFYQVLGEASGQQVEGEEHLLKLMAELVSAKREYDRVAEALRSVRETGYGLVSPEMSELTLEQPEIVRQGNRFGVKLKASAPSLHMIRVDIQTEVNPIVGTEQQSEELVKYLLSEFENDPDSIWDSNMFGKSLNELVREGLSNKLMRMPDDVRMKLKETLQRIINEGSGGMICILL
ncbi:stage IV sporulation protein A [Eubacteriales bacterium OttesenSCG-928-N13]|nr:stage IV sporulation protein A [Eubacteriales bacterium OttesenSCG-928-N13]